MHCSETVLLSLAVAIVIASPTISRAQMKSPQTQRDADTSPRAKADYSGEPYVIQQARTVIRFENDGTGERTSSARIRLQNDSAAEKFSQLVFPFSATNEKVQVRRVVVHKRDGTTTVAPTDAISEASPDVKGDTAYPTEIEKHISVTGLAAGDTLDYEVVSRLAIPFAANEFWAAQNFIRDAVVLDDEVEFNLPQGCAFSLKAPGYSVVDGKIQPNTPAAKEVSFSRSDAGGRTVLRWRHANLTHSSDDDQQHAAEEARRSPDIQLTSFRNWQELAHWELGLWNNKAQPNAELTAKAAELTRDLTTVDQKVRALYAFVSKNFRFVNSAFGSERFAPRSATEILTSGYGDCADSHVLLASLLKAAGIQPDAALIPAARKLDTSLPSPAQFECILTVVPRGTSAIWLDPSAEVAPFDFLPASLRGQSALVIQPDGAAKIEKTPVDPPFASTQTVEIDGTVSDLGKLSGTIHYSVRGDTEFVLRSAFHRTPQSQWNQLAQTVLTLDGLRGEVGVVNASAPEDTAKPFELQIAFSQQAFLDWSSHSTRVPLPLLTIGMPDAPAHADSTIELGTPLNVVTHLRLKFPSHFSIEPPIGTDVKRDYANFSSAYRFESGVLTADRSVDFKRREIPAGRATDYRAFAAAVNTDEAQSLAISNTASNPGTIPANASADDVFDAATAALKLGNPNAAILLFERVTEIDPKHAHAWNDLGLAYLRAGKVDDAVSAFRKQLELSRSDEHANNYLGVALEQQHRDTEAAAAFKAQIALAPLDTVAHGALGNLLLQQHDDAAAVSELEKAVILVPKNAEFEVSLGRAYLGVGENEKALDAFHKAIALSPTPAVWNNVAYNLAEHNLDLDDALEYANAAVKAENESLANLTLAHVTQADFARTSDLAAYWDTLGWVYFRKGDVAPAERYVTSALLVSSHAICFDHLAQIYGKRGDKQRAAQMYAAALSKQDADPGTRARFTLLLGGNAQIDALVATARNNAPKIHLHMASTDSTASGSADFFILFSVRRTDNGVLLAHVDDVKFSAGSESLRTFAPLLRSLDYGAMFPVASAAKLVIRGKLECAGPGGCDLRIPIAELGDSAR